MNGPKFKSTNVQPMLARDEEPFDVIRARVDALEPGHGLIVVAPLLPAPLIEVLKSESFASSLNRRVDGGYSVGFWRE